MWKIVSKCRNYGYFLGFCVSPHFQQEKKSALFLMIRKKDPFLIKKIKGKKERRDERELGVLVCPHLVICSILCKLWGFFILEDLGHQPGQLVRQSSIRAIRVISHLFAPLVWSRSGFSVNKQKHSITLIQKWLSLGYHWAPTALMFCQLYSPVLSQSLARRPMGIPRQILEVTLVTQQDMASVSFIHPYSALMNWPEAVTALLTPQLVC